MLKRHSRLNRVLKNFFIHRNNLRLYILIIQPLSNCFFVNDSGLIDQFIIRERPPDGLRNGFRIFRRYQNSCFAINNPVPRTARVGLPGKEPMTIASKNDVLIPSLMANPMDSLAFPCQASISSWEQYGMMSTGIPVFCDRTVAASTTSGAAR